MRIDSAIKYGLPWPEPYKGKNEHFRVTLDWPVIKQETLLVATFQRNREKPYWGTRTEDFRLVCSK